VRVTQLSNYEHVPESGGKTTIRGLVRKHDFRQLLTGFAISSAGDWLYGVALLVFVYDQTGSAAWVGAATIIRLLPYILFGAIGGVVADRYEKRTVMIVSDLARAALMFALTLVALADVHASVALAITFLATAAGTPEGPALASLMPKVCDEDELASANSLMSTVDNVALVVGPAIGAMLLLLGSPAAAFAANGLTFLAASFFASRISIRSAATEEHEETQGILQRLAEGVGGIRASGAASLLVSLLVAAAALYGFELVFVVLLAEGPLGMGSDGVGWLTTAVGVGGIAAAGVTGRVASSRRGDVVLLAAVALMGLPFVLLAASDLAPLALLCMAVIGAGSILFEVIGVTILQRVVPENLLARVFGILDSLSVAAMLVGSVLGPIMVRVFGLGTSMVIVGLTLPGVCLLAIPKLRALRLVANKTMDELAPVAALLERSGAFEGAPLQTLEALAAAATRDEVPAGTVVVQEGESADYFYVIESGRLDVTSMGETGTSSETVNELTDGDYFGEIGLLEGVPRTATVTASAACVLYRISGGDFLESVQQAPAPPATLMTSLASRLTRTHPSLAPTTTGGTDA
jgi:MFS family permease